MNISVTIADDHAIVRQGLRALLEKAGGITIRGEACDGKELLELAAKKPSDVYIIDIAMPRLNGLEAASRLLRSDSKSGVIFLSMHSDRAMVRKAMEAGGRGYVLKENTAEDLVRAIQAVSRGGSYFSAAVPEPGSPDPGSPVCRLTSKEREIVQLIAEGLADKEISRKLKISANTVHAHRNNISRKLDIHKQTDLVRFAIKEKITVL